MRKRRQEEIHMGSWLRGRQKNERPERRRRNGSTIWYVLTPLTMSTSCTYIFDRFSRIDLGISSAHWPRGWFYHLSMVMQVADLPLSLAFSLARFALWWHDQSSVVVQATARFLSRLHVVPVSSAVSFVVRAMRSMHPTE